MSLPGLGLDDVLFLNASFLNPAHFPATIEYQSKNALTCCWIEYRKLFKEAVSRRFTY